MNILSVYTSSVFQDFESFLRRQIDLVEDDNSLVLDGYNSIFITYELQPGNYTFKDISEVLLNFLQSEYKGEIIKIVFEIDDITRKTKFNVRPGILAIRFDKKSFFSTIFGFTPGWDCKHYNEYSSQKVVNLSNTIKIHLKCVCIDSSFQKG